MKRIMITILAISALQANVFAADGAGKPSKKRTVDGAEKSLTLLEAELSVVEAKLSVVEARKRTRSQVAEHQRLVLEIERLAIAADSLREAISHATSANAADEKTRLENELALIAGEEAELNAKLEQSSRLLTEHPHGSIILEGKVVHDLENYTLYLKNEATIILARESLNEARESEAVLNGRIETQSSAVPQAAAQASGWFGTAVSWKDAVVDHLTGAKAALARTQERLATTQGRIAALLVTITDKKALSGFYKSAACRPAAAHVHSDEIV